jgi:hypothetical protein
MPLFVRRVLTERRMIIPITALSVDVSPPIVHAAYLFRSCIRRSSYSAKRDTVIP